MFLFAIRICTVCADDRGDLSFVLIMHRITQTLLRYDTFIEIWQPKKLDHHNTYIKYIYDT